RTFRPVSEQRGLGFTVEIVKDAPSRITTDHQLLEQILRNLLANAFKFTERGQVRLRVAPAAAGLVYRAESLKHAPAVLSFAVSDTGIAISQDKWELIFDAFQQGDPSVTRKYGGTGLGLTISREYSRVLGGEISLQSTPGVGSTFSLYLPLI